MGRSRTVARALVLAVLVGCTSSTPGNIATPRASSTTRPIPSRSTQSPRSDPPRIVVPLVEGSKVIAASRRLRRLGLRLRVRRKVSRARPATVLAQYPQAGMRVRARRTVLLIVAKAPPPPARCPPNPLRGVYHPDRLQVIAPCRVFRGRVRYVRHEEDGDYHVVVRPDPGFHRFLNAGNDRDQHGGLVTEIMPGQHLGAPYVGEHVAVLGTWVYDADHGWREIHPIWAITDLSTGRRRYSLPPVPPRYSPDEGGGGGSGGGRVTAICRDGTRSYSRHASGTCSGHGGVRTWIHHPAN